MCTLNIYKKTNTTKYIFIFGVMHVFSMQYHINIIKYLKNFPLIEVF